MYLDIGSRVPCSQIAARRIETAAGAVNQLSSHRGDWLRSPSAFRAWGLAIRSIGTWCTAVRRSSRLPGPRPGRRRLRRPIRSSSSSLAQSRRRQRLPEARQGRHGARRGALGGTAKAYESTDPTTIRQISRRRPRRRASSSPSASSSTTCCPRWRRPIRTPSSCSSTAAPRRWRRTSSARCSANMRRPSSPAPRPG